MLKTNAFWTGIIAGVITWILGSVIWQVFFYPKLKDQGLA